MSMMGHSQSALTPVNWTLRQLSISAVFMVVGSRVLDASRTADDPLKPRPTFL